MKRFLVHTPHRYAELPYLMGAVPCGMFPIRMVTVEMVLALCPSCLKSPVSEIPYIFNEDSAYRWHR